MMIDDINEVIRLCWMKWNNNHDTWSCAKIILEGNDPIPEEFMELVSNHKPYMSQNCRQQWLELKLSEQKWGDIFDFEHLSAHSHS